jgi:hypothetical protein
LVRVWSVAPVPVVVDDPAVPVVLVLVVPLADAPGRVEVDPDTPADAVAPVPIWTLFSMNVPF